MSLHTDSALPAPALFEDSDLIVKGLPQLCIPCATITISSKHVLKRAAKKLGVSIHGYTTTSLGDEITVSVSMDVPPHEGNPLKKRLEFYGEWSMFLSEAKESACLAALTYLKDENLIVVHDTNYSDMKKYKRKFEEQDFWAAVLYDRASSLKEQLPAKAAAVILTKNPALGGRNEPAPLRADTGSSTSVSTFVARGSTMRYGARKSLFLAS